MQADPYVHLTELAGAPISDEQLQRMVNRYGWASQFCVGKRVLETACGSGPGLKLLASSAERLVAGDYSPAILRYASGAAHVPLLRFDAQSLPFSDASFDVVLMFEALYYLPRPEQFFAEAARVLRPGGALLIATANCDLYDFNPSPHSHLYFGADRLVARLRDHGFDARVYGDHSTTAISLRQRILRPAKAIVVRSGLFPRTARSKLWMKRIVFGRLREMPSAIDLDTMPFHQPSPIDGTAPDRRHKVILCEARKLAS